MMPPIEEMMSIPIEEQGLMNPNPDDPAPHEGVITLEAGRRACKLFGHPRFEVSSEGLHSCPRCGADVIRTPGPKA